MSSTRSAGSAASFVDRAGINIEDVRIEHATSQLTGLVHVSVAPCLTVPLKEALQARGWRLR
ncbi:hypothetical protein [Streptomyces sp. NPDC048473]|uniref:hypothetical protein n=1 Tax=unclassified Streptomyces TaxID=2593676 RepID=UPI0037243BFB